METRLCPPDNHPQSNQDTSFFSGQTVYENTAYRLDDRDWPEDEITGHFTDYKSTGHFLNRTG